tara:strand:- start:2668 stop:3231 length:564 start_codon:yes stop_codon:yes gene_type:complete
MAKVHQNNGTYFYHGKEKTIPVGYRISNKLRVFPPQSERPSTIAEAEKREGKPASKTTKESVVMWEKVLEYVKRHNALPSSESDEQEVREMHSWLLKKPSIDSAPRMYYIHQDGVAPWVPVYDENSAIKGYLNRRTGQSITATKDTIQPEPIYYDCLVSNAEFATNVVPSKMNTQLKTTENKPGQGK